MNKWDCQICCGPETDEILGLHMAGYMTELIVEGARTRLEATIDEILTTIHAHPTVAESIMEAACGPRAALHLPRR